MDTCLGTSDFQRCSMLWSSSSRFVLASTKQKREQNQFASDRDLTTCIRA